MECTQLQPHPNTPLAAVDDLSVELSRAGNLLALRFHLTGQLSQLQIPQSVAPKRSDGLWEHSCFEVFVRQAGKANYDEHNFSPSRQWQHYQFSAYRRDQSQPDVMAPQIAVLQQPNELKLITSIHVPDGPLEIGLSAVLESENGSLSYWALHHASDKPDFHHADAFALKLA